MYFYFLQNLFYNIKKRKMLNVISEYEKTFKQAINLLSLYLFSFYIIKRRN